jgi:hypothetical protein
VDCKCLVTRESLESTGVSTMVSASLAKFVLWWRDQGFGLKQISRKLKVCRYTVRRLSRLDHWEPYKRTKRLGRLSDLGPWLEAEFIRHHGKCDVFRQELKRQRGMHVNNRTIHHADKQLRARMVASALATVRF